MLYRSKSQGHFGLINANRDLVVTYSYSYIGHFSDGYCVAVRPESTCELIDLAGKVVTRAKGIGTVMGGHVAWCEGELYGVRALSGTELISPQFDSIGIISEGVAACVDNQSTVNLIRLYGGESLGKYDDVLGFYEGLCFVSRKDEKYYVSHAGKRVNRRNIEGGCSFSSGLAWIKCEEKMELVDVSFNTLLDNDEVTDALRPSCGLSGVELEGEQWAMLEIASRKILPGRFAGVSRCRSGVFCFQNEDELWGIRSIEGRIIWECQFDEIQLFEGIAEVRMYPDLTSELIGWIVSTEQRWIVPL